MPCFVSNIPRFKCWVRKEFTHNHEKYRGEFIHVRTFAVTTMPDRTLGLEVVLLVVRLMAQMKQIFMVVQCGLECL